MQFTWYFLYVAIGVTVHVYHRFKVRINVLYMFSVQHVNVCLLGQMRNDMYSSACASDLMKRSKVTWWRCHKLIQLYLMSCEQHAQLCDDLMHILHTVHA